MGREFSRIEFLGADRRQDFAKYSGRRSRLCVQPSSIPSRYGAARAGTYYVIVVDDSGGTVVESVETKRLGVKSPLKKNRFGRRKNSRLISSTSRIGQGTHPNSGSLIRSKFNPVYGLDNPRRAIGDAVDGLAAG